MMQASMVWGAICSVIDEEDESIDHNICRILFEQFLAFDDKCREYRGEDSSKKLRLDVQSLTSSLSTTTASFTYTSQSED